MNDFFSKLLNWLSTSGLRIILGLIVVLILFKLVNVISGKIKKNMEKRNVEKTIVTVTYSVIKKGIKILVVLLYIGYLGIDTSSIGALIASIGVALGLALQGSLSNLAGGILIIILRPFKIEDYIEAQSVSGTVEEISVFYTYLVTPDNKVIMIPNGSLLNGNIINYSKKDIRRVDLNFSISYNQDFEKVTEVIKNLCNTNNMIFKYPEPFIRISEHKDSCLNVIVRVWSKSSDYWAVFFKMQEDVKKVFEINDIEIPFPQLDVHMDKTDIKTNNTTKKRY